MSSLVGQTLQDRYFLRKHVGVGGMADVYLAWDKMRSTTMAVKVLRRDLVHNSRFFRHFAKEAELLRRLEHPHIVRLYEFERDEQFDVVFIVMDWIDGVDLRKMIEKRGKRPLSVDEVSGILQPVSSALQYAHQMGVFHCDVKPANILIQDTGQVLLTDFGVARMANEYSGGGTPPYMAPEQFLGQSVDGRTDVYALGVTIYELLSGGRLPFVGRSAESQGSTLKERIAWEHLNLPPPPLRQFNPEVSERVEAVLLRALQKRPEERFPTVSAFREAFERARLAMGDVMPPYLSEPQPPAPAGGMSEHGLSLGEGPLSSSRPPKPRQPSGRRTIFQTLLDFRYKLGRPRLTEPPPGQSVALSTRKANAVLVVREGDLAGQVIPLPRGELRLGRGSQNDVRFYDRNVSRKHVTLLSTRRGVYVRDEGSTVGTFINGQRIPVGVPVRLRPGDVLQLGYRQIMEFREV